jgi:TIR domain
VASDTSTVTPAASKRAFVSYSHSDRQRVLGVCQLLESFGHRVFLDRFAIRPGSRWEHKIKDGLDQADALIVFWTKYAACSRWVHREYEHFLAHSPEKPLMPVVGDETPLPEPLAARQSLDFCPLINELLGMRAELERQGVSKDEVRAAISRRLDEAGVLRDEKQRRKFFRSFGLAGFAHTSLMLFASTLDKGVDAMSQMSMAQAMTIGALAVGGTVAYQFLDPFDTTTVYLVDVTEGQTGSEACYARGMSCLSLTTNPISDSEGRIFGFATPSCDSQVIRTTECGGFDTEFAITRVMTTKSPNADEGVAGISEGLNMSCLRDSKGIYEFAYCVER